MEANKILQADLLDLIFEDRNKSYGAYELRKRYNRRISLALGITAAMAALLFGSFWVSRALAPTEDDKVVVRDVVLENVKPPEEEEAPPPPPPPPQVEPPPQIETVQFTPPVIKKDEEVRQEEIPPVRELEEKRIDVISQEGIKDPGIIIPPVVDAGKGVVVEAPKEDMNKIFEKVEIEASVNLNQWRNHLERQLQRYIEDAMAQGMNPGQYTVQVRFVVERDGNITDVRALNDPGYGLAKGAVDVVKRGPKWTPGEQNGQKVRSYHTQPITFVISEY